MSEEPTKPQLTPEQVKALFTAYEQAAREVEAAEAALDTKKSKRSAAVKAIADSCGNGPFEYRSKRLSVMHKGDSYYFKGDSNKTIRIE